MRQNVVFFFLIVIESTKPTFGLTVFKHCNICIVIKIRKYNNWIGLRNMIKAKSEITFRCSYYMYAFSLLHDIDSMLTSVSFNMIMAKKYRDPIKFAFNSSMHPYIFAHTSMHMCVHTHPHHIPHPHTRKAKNISK